MSLPPALDHIGDPRLRRFTEYWLSRRKGRPVPTRKDIDPPDIPWILKWIWLMEYQAESDRFLCRLAGENVNAFVCNNIGGHYIGGHFLDEYMPKSVLSELSERYRMVVQKCVIMHASGLFSTQSYHADGERIAFPLANDDGTVNLLIGATLYGPRAHEDEAIVTEQTVLRYTSLADLDVT